MYYKSLGCLAQHVNYDDWVRKGFEAQSHTFPGVLPTENDGHLLPTVPGVSFKLWQGTDGRLVQRPRGAWRRVLTAR